MNKLSFRDAAELIGLTAIVASLIFVGLELQQSQRIAIADQYQMRMDANVQFIGSTSEQSLIGSGTRFLERLPALDMPERVKQELSELAPVELGELTNRVLQALLIMDNSHYQYQNGFMEEETWQSVRARYIRNLGNGWLARSMVLDRSDTWRASFVEEIREIYREIDASQAP